ncbi:F-box only protein 21-like [Gigantopelta aegis]|uniref:F-box only protein 21-like n=1 Tax=Gigantopelta aegis TaxID=1735272 RepID=UPI001B888D93|nr:F-box only protein 21-like [Gigantopelta aegis]
MDGIQFLDLPYEIIELVLKTSSVQLNDLVSVSLTCRKLHDVCLSNDLWKVKLKQRWSSLLDMYDRKTPRQWLDVYKQRHLFGKRTLSMVQQLSSQFYNMQEISKDGFSSFSSLLDEHQHASTSVVDELMQIVHDGKIYENLTRKYYAEKVLRNIQQLHLTKKWQELLSRPPAEQRLETGAVLISQWCQPTVNIAENVISDRLNNIAQQVRYSLQCRCQDHPACRPVELPDQMSTSLWSPEQSRLVLESVNCVLFEDQGFRGNDLMYYSPENSFINKVLETRKGIPITLCILYSCVARRLGVLCEPVNFPTHFLLRWMENPMASPNQQYTYIDVFRKGIFMKQEECCAVLDIPASMGSNNDIYHSVAPQQVFERMARNLVGIGRHQSQMGDTLMCLRNALELLLTISPDDLEMRLLEVRIYLHLNINLPQVLDSLQRIADLDASRMGVVAYLQQEAEMQMQENNSSKNNKKKKLKLREDNKDVKFSVGMVMKHKRYLYMCVIYGWDNTCQASDEWILQMGVNNLPYKQHQPFYNVLVEDGSNRYAAQENMLYLDDPKVISHPEVGRYFEQYCSTHYIPNEEKRTEYPDDVAETERLVTEYYGSSVR